MLTATPAGTSGPVMDTVKERPYEELNSLFNDGVPHGRCYYLKGVSQKTIRYDLTAQALTKVTEVVKAGKFRSAMLFEYFSLKKVNAVPVPATAFRRELSSNILVQLTWDGEHPEWTGEAREVAKDLVDVVLRKQGMLNDSEKLGYTNYGHGKHHSLSR